MAQNKNLQKLELTWIGKGDEPKLEPRILIENPEYSYGDPNTENMLIHGDNLLALKALEQDYAGKVKCIYIDPPYNTGNAFEHYDDGIEHSLWLSLMKQRLNILKELLNESGVLFISIDDDEVHYLKVICDEVFGRRNFAGTLIWEKKKKPSFLSNMGSVTEYILCYTKEKSKSPAFIYGETTVGKKYPINNAGNGLAILTFPPKSIKFKIKDSVIKAQDMSGGNIKTVLLNDVQIENGYNLNEFKLEGEWRYSQKKIEEIIRNNEEIVISQIPFRPNHIKSGGEPKKMKNLLSISHFGISTYEDSNKESELLFGKNSFDYPKPEQLISILINSVTDPGDLVLDSFLGSGTTAAVAHKMGRKYIGIELGEHASTHCYPRLKQVVDGEQGGVSKAVNWQGGGGFKFYTLAPSLLKKDKFGQWIMSDEYNADMLAAAMAKQEGFKYNPSETQFWKQGNSSEQDFIFTTTQFLTVQQLEAIAEDMQAGESLLICCKAFQTECKNKFPNITIKKIPQLLLDRCEFGKDDYSLNIVNIPQEDNQEDYDVEEEIENDEEVVDTKENNQKSLFD
ncbi:site-specific DNA-methyltransferase [Empedobacter falsenii]